MANWTVALNGRQEAGLSEARARYNLDQAARDPEHVDLTDQQYWELVTGNMATDWAKNLSAPRGVSDRDIVEAYKNASAANRTAANAALGLS